MTTSPFPGVHSVTHSLIFSLPCLFSPWWPSFFLNIDEATASRSRSFPDKICSKPSFTQSSRHTLSSQCRTSTKFLLPMTFSNADLPLVTGSPFTAKIIAPTLRRFIGWEFVNKPCESICDTRTSPSVTKFLRGMPLILEVIKRTPCEIAPWSPGPAFRLTWQYWNPLGRSVVLILRESVSLDWVIRVAAIFGSLTRFSFTLRTSCPG
mmetsp:Transcript_17455/g.35552  ORF Transcript_17455/g.35552 Transcript_17455/m.35552 type:complete len:208 (-) Transcript_17455:1821-2444(-)